MEDEQKGNAPSEEQLNAWKQQHGEVIEVTVDERSFYARKPTRSEYKRFIDTMGRSLYDASLQLVLDCLLQPSAKELMVLLDENPNLHIQIVGELQTKFGANVPVSSKKL